MAVVGSPLPPIRPAASVGALRLLQAFRSDVLGAFGADAYSDLRVSFRRFGRRFVFLSDPEDINHVLNTHIDRYQANILAERLLEPLTGRGIVLAEGEEWTQLHRRLIPAFQPRHIERLIPSFHETAAHHVASWCDGAASERNLLVDFRRLTLDIIARSMLSIEDEATTTQLADFASAAESAAPCCDGRTMSPCWSGRASPSRPSARRSACDGGPGSRTFSTAGRRSTIPTRRATCSI